MDRLLLSIFICPSFPDVRLHAFPSGIFIALMLRYDHYCHKLEKKEGPVKPAYYNVVMVGYGIGLTATLVVMYYFNAAQVR